MKTNHISLSQSKVNWSAETQRIIKWIADTGVMAVYIDLFCGFGGTTSGVEQAEHEGKKMGQVILGINHDDIALACHRAHNPYTLHLREDVRKVKLQPIADMVSEIRKAFPWIKVFLWCSAECTHHSKAKGGDSRDPDSRSLAEELFRYEQAIKPDVIQVENVTEFRSWGPLEQKVISMHKRPGKIWKYKKKTKFGLLISKNQKTWVNPKNGLAFKSDKKRGISEWMVPIPDRKAEYFNEWKEHLISGGYVYDSKDINSADQGAYTARKRYYGQFTKTIPVLWPEATHAKDPEKLFEKTGKRLLKYKPVKDVLDLKDSGMSIFREDSLSDKTYERVYEGLIKFIAGGKEPFSNFVMRYYSGSPEHRNHSIDEPAGTVTTNNRMALATIEFLSKYFSGNAKGKNVSVDGPAGTITTVDHHALVTSEFLLNYHHSSKCDSVDKPVGALTTKDKRAFITTYHGNGHNCTPIDNPAPTIPCKDSAALVTPFIMRDFSRTTNSSVDSPAGALTNNPKMNLVQPEYYLMNLYQYGGKTTSSIEKPCFTLIARMDKAPPYLMEIEGGQIAIRIYKTDTKFMILIKEFMAMYGIVDIKMRMLKEMELLPIQGFPPDYIDKVRAMGIKVTGTNAKKYIGNSQEVTTARCLLEAYGPTLFKLKEQYFKKAA